MSVTVCEALPMDQWENDCEDDLGTNFALVGSRLVTSEIQKPKHCKRQIYEWASSKECKRPVSTTKEEISVITIYNNILIVRDEWSNYMSDCRESQFLNCSAQSKTSDQSISMIDYQVYRTIRESIWTRFSHRSYSNALKLHSSRGSRKRPVPSVIKKAKEYNYLRLNLQPCLIIIPLQNSSHFYSNISCYSLIILPFWF